MNYKIVAVIEKIELSHQVIAKTISDFDNELRTYNNKLSELNGRFNGLEQKVDELAPILKQYNENKTIENNDKKRGVLIVKWAGALIATGSTDTAGEITEGTVSTGCVITFAVAKTNAPFCTVTGKAGLVFTYAVSTTAITVTNVGALSGTNIVYQCISNNN